MTQFNLLRPSDEYPTRALLDLMAGRATIPLTEGFYWAVWRVSKPERPGSEFLSRGAGWCMVEVFCNNPDPESPAHFRVLVPGVEASEPTDNFVWGPGPVMPPAPLE